jgi:hypothetical protein
VEDSQAIPKSVYFVKFPKEMEKELLDLEFQFESIPKSVYFVKFLKEMEKELLDLEFQFESLS